MMHTLQSLVGGAILAGVATIATMPIFRGDHPGIVIHSLTFTNDPQPAIVQDRTVTAANALTAKWTAEITAGGAPVPECKGSGHWDYAAGRKTPTIPVNEWVGSKSCWDALPVGVTLQACATYTWSDGENAKQCSIGFRKQNG